MTFLHGKLSKITIYQQNISSIKMALSDTRISAKENMMKPKNNRGTSGNRRKGGEVKRQWIFKKIKQKKPIWEKHEEWICSQRNRFERKWMDNYRKMERNRREHCVRRSWRNIASCFSCHESKISYWAEKEYEVWLMETGFMENAGWCDEYYVQLDGSSGLTFDFGERAETA